MRKIMMILFLLIDLMAFGQSNYSIGHYPVTSAGGTVTTHCCTYPQLTSDVFVYTNGAVALGGNTYTISNDSLPNKAEWWVYCYFGGLTTNTASNVNIFGVTPLVDWPGADTFVIHFMVIHPTTTSKALQWNYVSANVKTQGVIPGSVTFSGVVTFNDSIVYTTPPVERSTETSVLMWGANTSTIGTGCGLVCGDSSRFWLLDGNSGIGGGNRFLGTNDTAALTFKVNAVKSGGVDKNLENASLGYQTFVSNTSGSANAAVGYQAMEGNTTGTGNAALGAIALANNTTGIDNTTIGAASGLLITTGSYNTGVGQASLVAASTGSYNTCIGYNSGVNLTSGTKNVLIGRLAQTNSAGITDGAGIGDSVNVYSNTFSIGPYINQVFFPGHSSGLNYVLTDTSGNGNFVPKVNNSTSIQTDSVVLTNAQILLLNGTPITIIPAPGANKYIKVLGISSIYIYGGGAYATNTTLNYIEGGSNVIASDAVSLVATGNTFYSPSLAAAAFSDNSAVIAKVATGNPTAGNSGNSMKIIIQFITITE